MIIGVERPERKFYAISKLAFTIDDDGFTGIAVNDVGFIIIVCPRLIIIIRACNHDSPVGGRLIIHRKTVGGIVAVLQLIVFGSGQLLNGAVSVVGHFAGINGNAVPSVLGKDI